MANNNKKSDLGSLFSIGIILFFVFPPIGIFIIFIAIMASKNAQNNGLNGEKKTDFSGVNKAMMKNQVVHNHSYTNHQTDFCGTDSSVVQGRAYNQQYNNNHQTNISGADKNVTHGKVNNQQYNNNHQTNISGVDKDVTHGKVHEQQYDNHKTDLGGTDNKMIQNVNSSGTSVKSTKQKKRRDSFYDGKTTEEIYRELVNRKTDYSGVDPNILRKR